MRRLLWASALAVSALVLRPAESKAYWGSPQCAHGMKWLEGKALNFMPFNHFNGPLFSYGPYNLPGYYPMYVANPHHGAYVPAYPAGYYGGYYGPGGALPPGAQMAPGTQAAAEQIAAPKSDQSSTSTAAPVEVYHGGKQGFFGHLKGRRHR